jgi:CelD/BcsL family acetyltransferase involved in cellulose biosynthesis
MSAAEVPDLRRGDQLGTPSDGDRIRVVRDVEGLSSVRDDWLRLMNDQVAADPDFYEAALNAEDQIIRPHVLVLERDGEVQAMLIGRVERLEFGVRAGYRKLYTPWVQSVTVVQGGILGEVDEATFRTLVRSLRQSLRDEGVDVAIFRYLPLGSALHRVASTEPPFLARQHSKDSEVHWELELPGSLDEILKALSSSTRQTVNRYTRKFEREYAGRMSIRTFTDASELDEFFRDVEPVSAKTYQRALGVSFGDTPKDRERTRASMEHGWFRGYVLYLDGEPRAFHHGELYRGRFRHGRPGYDPDFAHLRIGTYLLLKVFEDLIEHPEASVVDYGVGDADYKRRFGTRSWREASVVVYAPTLRAVRVNVVRTSLLAAVRLAKSVFGKGAVYKRIRRSWRRRLTRARAA